MSPPIKSDDVEDGKGEGWKGYEGCGRGDRDPTNVRDARDPTPARIHSPSHVRHFRGTSGATHAAVDGTKREGKQELSGPRSIPCTAALSFLKVRPLEKGLSPAP